MWDDLIQEDIRRGSLHENQHVEDEENNLSLVGKSKEKTKKKPTTLVISRAWIVKIDLFNLNLIKIPVLFTHVFSFKNLNLQQARLAWQTLENFKYPLVKIIFKVSIM